MTFDSQVASTVQGALADLRDKVGGMTNWSIEDDSVASDGYVVLNTPTVEQVYVGYQAVVDSANHSGSFNFAYIETGKGWDSANTSWSTESGKQVTDSSKDYPNARNDADADCEYWLGYVDGKGFVQYVRRVQGDGNDTAWSVGYQIHETEFWDVHGTDSANGYVGYGAVAAAHENNMEPGSSYRMSHQYGGEGILNPDANFTNYVWDKAVLQHNSVSNTETGFNIRGARLPSVWIRDQSGSDLASGDVIQDQSANNEYMVLTYHGSRCALSME